MPTGHYLNRGNHLFVFIVVSAERWGFGAEARIPCPELLQMVYEDAVSGSLQL